MDREPAVKVAGYSLSREAAAQQTRWDAQRGLPAKSDPWLGMSGLATGRQDGANFRTNQVTLAEYDDRFVATEGASLGLAATWACVNLLAGTIGSLPLSVYRTDKQGQLWKAADHPLYRVLHDRPNYDQTAVDFLEFMAASVELRGNAFASISRGTGERIIALTPVPPQLVNVRRVRDGSLAYTWTDDGKREDRRQDEMLHIRGFGGGPLGGMSPLAVCRRAFGGALAVERSAGAMFSNGVRSSGVLSTEKLLTREQREDLDRLLVEKFIGSANAGRPMLLDNGLSWHQLTIDPTDAQMLESRKFSGEEICRLFGVPPAMVGYGDKASNWGTGKEQDVLGFEKFNLRRRCKRIEAAMEQQLLTPAEREGGLRVEFNMEGLLRADSAGRSTFYQKMTQIGAMTINEVRAKENLPPVPGGDVPRMQSQTVPITDAPTLPTPELEE